MQHKMTDPTPETELDIVMAILSGKAANRCYTILEHNIQCKHWARKVGSPNYYYCMCHWALGMADLNDKHNEFWCDGSAFKPEEFKDGNCK